MTEEEMLQRMIAPGTKRPGKYRLGVIQIHVTRACDKACYACTQGSNLAGSVEFMSPEHFEQAVRSLGFGKTIDVTTMHDRSHGLTVEMPLNDGAYFGVVGVFGGNPALSPHFHAYCETLRRLVPFEQRGLWCNNPVTLDKAKEMARTFDPSVSNLNVHLDQDAWSMFKMGWPKSQPVGLTVDSRHAPVHLAMKDVVTITCPICFGAGEIGTGHAGINLNCKSCKGTGLVSDDDRIRELISTCDINQHWSAMVGVFRGELRAWFCEVAGAQAMLHQHEPDYPDTGVRITDCLQLCEIPDWEALNGHGAVTSYPEPWWQLPMTEYRWQVRKHCFECGVPLRAYGELSQALDGKEQTSATHESVFRPKRKGRPVELVSSLTQLGLGKIQHVNHYLQNARV